MEYIGLFFEFLFLALGLYFYLFSRGFFKAKNAAKQKKAEVFRQKNATVLRLGGLAIAAVMVLNIVLHLATLFKS